MKQVLITFFICILFSIRANCQPMQWSKTYTNNGKTYTANLRFTDKAAAHNISGEDISSGQDFNYIVVDDNGNTTKEGFYYAPRVTYVINSQGQITAKKTTWEGYIYETYKYTDNGKVLRYDTNNVLLGVYDDFIDMHLSTQRYDNYIPGDTGLSSYIGNLNRTDENGNYTEYDSKGNILAVYSRDGGNETYSYDVGGNLIAIYNNGIATYRRRFYTPTEATAAVKNNKNTFSLKYR